MNAAIKAFKGSFQEQTVQQGSGIMRRKQGSVDTCTEAAEGGEGFCVADMKTFPSPSISSPHAHFSSLIRLETNKIKLLRQLRNS